MGKAVKAIPDSRFQIPNDIQVSGNALILFLVIITTKYKDDLISSCMGKVGIIERSMIRIVVVSFLWNLESGIWN